MKRPFRWYDYITINIYHLGLSTLSQTMAPLVLPLLIQGFVGEAQKATAYGNVRLWGLMVALLAQAFWGMLSDRSTLRWGRRRPFILFGTLTDLVFIAAIAFSAGLDGATGYFALFTAYLLLQVTTNAAQGAQQGFIPDLVPEELRGRFSAVKAVLEVPLPVILVSFTVGRLISAGNLTGGILAMTAVLVVSMAFAMLVPERRLDVARASIKEAWGSLVRLTIMTALFTVIILAMGQAVTLVGTLLQGIDGTATLMVGMGVAGLLAMLVAIAIGVWMSVRISIGEETNKNPSFTWWVVNRLAFLVGAFNLSGFFVYFLQARLGLERERAAGPAANMLLFVGVFILIFALAGGWLADRYGHRRIVALAGFVAAAGTVLAILVPNLTVIYVGGCIIGAGTGLFYTANWALGTQIVPRGEAGRYLGISNLAGAGAGAIGAYVGGPIADYFTLRVTDVPGLGYVLLFGIYGALFLLSALAVIPIAQRAPAQDAAPTLQTTTSTS